MEIDDAVLTITEKDAARLRPRFIAGWHGGFEYCARSFSFLRVRVFFFECGEGGYYQDVAVRNSVRNVLLSAPRGLIFDRYGKQLVRNVPSMELLATPGDLPDVRRGASVDDRTIAKLLSPLTRTNGRHCSDRPAARSLRRSCWKPSLTQDETLIFSARAAEFPGISLERSAVREYQDGLIFHISWDRGKIRKEELAEYPDYLPIDSIGKQGIEKVTSRNSRKARRRSVEVDSRGGKESPRCIRA